MRLGQTTSACITLWILTIVCNQECLCLSHSAHTTQQTTVFLSPTLTTTHMQTAVSKTNLVASTTTIPTATAGESPSVVITTYTWTVIGFAVATLLPTVVFILMVFAIMIAVLVRKEKDEHNVDEEEIEAQQEHIMASIPRMAIMNRHLHLRASIYGNPDDSYD